MTIGEIELLAHPEAKYNSFRVSCDVVSFKCLLDPDLWIEGICVDKYRQRANRADSHQNGEE